MLKIIENYSRKHFIMQRKWNSYEDELNIYRSTNMVILLFDQNNVGIVLGFF